MALAVTTVRADEKKEPRNDSPADARLERFKQLAGDWTGTISGGGGKDKTEVRVNYKVTSAGSAVVETITPGAEHEMVTVIHKDGDDLVLTHYCAIGNQPRMKAERGDDDKKIAFKFTGATNLKSDKDLHMHDAVFTFVDKDTLKVEWTNFNDGRAAGTATFELKRKK
jgi:hypothetical protein